MANSAIASFSISAIPTLSLVHYQYASKEWIHVMMNWRRSLCLLRAVDLKGWTTRRASTCGFTGRAADARCELGGDNGNLALTWKNAPWILMGARFLLGPQVPTPIYTTREEVSLASEFHRSQPSTNLPKTSSYFFSLHLTKYASWHPLQAAHVRLLYMPLVGWRTAGDL